jgi:hypothetical protein
LEGPTLPMALSTNGNPLLIWRTLTKQNGRWMGKWKKPGHISQPVQVKYGIVVPWSVKHARELDAQNGNTLWSDAIKKEIDSLLWLGCFDFCAPDFKHSSE